MDSYLDTAPARFPSLAEVRSAIQKLEAEHKQHEVPLTGRIIHTCHYLPVVLSLSGHGPTGGLLSPPKTPDIIPSDQGLQMTTHGPHQNGANGTNGVEKESAKPRWSLATRRGHTAMISGIESLADADHQQLIVAWTGDILQEGSDETVPLEELNEAEIKDMVHTVETFKGAKGDDIKYIPVTLNEKIAHGHYDGYCKTTLWPLLHYLLWQDVATETPSQDQYWETYVQANQAYADAIASVYQAGDLVWVHDYHLLLVPRMLRQLLPDAHIGLFVHTPFPSSEVFRCLPRRKEILDGMLGANLVCFQTYSYARHFTSTCIRVNGYESAPGGVDVQGNQVSIQFCPVGVDAERVAKDRDAPGVKPTLEALLQLYKGKKIIVGRDKLDLVKGVLQKLRAFEKLFIDYPEWQGNVVLIQVTSPALTDSPKLERQVSELVSHINGEYGSLDFIPVHHYHQAIKKDEYIALLCAADLALITPLRDGMNTTSMEFVICQQGGKKSPVVLSEFMGTSGNMTAALQVNPWNLGDVARVINQGLTMGDVEKASRQETLYNIVSTHTSHTWAAVLVRMLLSHIGHEHTAHQTPYLDMEHIRSSYYAAKKRLMLFDYDGTLTPIVKTPSMAVPSPSTLQALEALSSDPKNLVYIISGRDGAFLEQHLGHFKGIGMSAEHGCFMREPGAGDWTNLTKSLDMSWMKEVEEIFQYFTERTTGSFIELKKSSITWHYRQCDPEWGDFQCKQCLDLLESNLVPKRPIEVLVGKKNLEVRPIAINKGEIVKRILYNNPDAEFVFCAGDDKTDEDMFRALNLFPIGVTSVTMPPPVTAALTRPPTPSGGLSKELEPVKLALMPDRVFSTAVGPSGKKTFAQWHVETPEEVVAAMEKILAP
ncbi:glycosyltransferase family 20 protein [Calocera cornea HHB12733]|uniref:Glycosyltransferase family 20 protein n=1 Tax=Calocera cornea HHB12733 TaxID=1353952 RepID=A0A165ITN6_9BASI|nr:glycosyltransferase family 20 protein [Calocera cornea HHB12733]